MDPNRANVLSPTVNVFHLFHRSTGSRKVLLVPTPAAALLARRKLLRCAVRPTTGMARPDRPAWVLASSADPTRRRSWNGSPRPAHLGARSVRRPHASPTSPAPTLLFCLPPRDADSEAWSPMRYFAPPLRVAEASFPPSSPRPTRSQMHQRREGMYIWLTTHPMQIACSVGDEFGDAHWIERDKCICICLLESALGSEILGRE
jgi:hypothetical protein